MASSKPGPQATVRGGAKRAVADSSGKPPKATKSELQLSKKFAAQPASAENVVARERYLQSPRELPEFMISAA